MIHNMHGSYTLRSNTSKEKLIRDLEIEKTLKKNKSKRKKHERNMENGTIPPRVTFEDHATYIGPLHFKIQIVSFAPTFNFYICESSGGGHATNKYAKIHEEV